ncbi:MAG: VacJ family lipoprotein [Parvularculaceae bacterium]|nr:VacJ family lipoprotein [Parvularculaceae bacterium]
MTKFSTSVHALCLVAIFFVAGAAYAQEEPAADPSAPEVEAAGSVETDPWEGFNRQVFGFNDLVDDYFFVPAAKTYRATTPKAGRRGIRRFLSNLGSPSVFVNDLLQGEIGRAGKTLSRFAINSTIGAGGFADPAGKMGIDGHSEDFGQTLAVWGVSSGPYLVLPLLGPSSPRDAFGSIAEIGLAPLTYVRTPPANYARLSLAGANLLSARENVLDPLAEIEANSLDYYSSFRSFYTQARAREIRNGVADYDALPTFDEFEDIE